METKKFNVVDRGCGGYCGLYGIDSLEVSDIVVAVRYSYIGNDSRKYYEIPVSEKNQNAVIAAFPELNLKEDEPGYIDLYDCDDETAVKVGTFAAELDGDLTPEPETPNNNDNTMKANNTYNVVIANEACNFTATKYNTTLTGFTSSEAAKNAAREALRDIAGEMGKGEKVFYSETLNAWILSSSSRGFAGSVWYLTAKIVKVETEEQTTDTPANENEASELTEAANLLNIYVDNEGDIYSKYTEKAIAAVVDAKRENENGNARLDDATAWDNLAFWISWQPIVRKAINAAVRIVKKFDGVTPTAKDIEHVTRNYAAYIVECAQYQIETA